MSHPSSAPSRLCVALDGYTDLPPGKLANLVTYLEMTRPPPPRPAPSAGRALVPFEGDAQAYRALFRRIGERWLWHGRLRLSEEELTATLADPAVTVFVLREGEREIGMSELDRRADGECELAYFGVVPEAIGSGAGRFLMNETLARAFARPIRRLFVHTCSFDHPDAVGFYVRSGFAPYKLAVEIHDDPRLTGLLPEDAAPHVPLLRARG